MAEKMPFRVNVSTSFDTYCSRSFVFLVPRLFALVSTS